MQVRSTTAKTGKKKTHTCKEKKPCPLNGLWKVASEQTLSLFKLRLMKSGETFINLNLD